MKKIIFFLLLVIFTSNLLAQSPQKMSYQAIIRNSDNTIIPNAKIGMRISLLKGSSTGTPVYVETQITSSNADGLVTINIGEGTIVSGSFSTISWSNGAYFVKTETDPAGGANYSISGTSQLLSVPYALYSSKSGEALYSKKSGQASGTVSVVDYGAFPAPNWPTAIDNTAAFQAAIDANPGKRILIPAGCYSLSNNITINNKLDIVGEGMVTQIQPVNCNGFIINSNEVSIEGMNLIGSQNGSSQNYGIQCNNSNYLSFANLRIENFNAGISVLHGSNIMFNNLCIRYVNGIAPYVFDGIKFYGHCLNNQINQCQISVQGGSCIAIYSDGTQPAEGLMVSNCLLAMGQSGILSLNVTNCIIDYCTGYAIYGINTNGLLLTNNWIASNNPNAGIDEAIHLQDSFNAHISNNNLQTTNGCRCISLYNINNSTISGNTIEMISNPNGNNIFIDNQSINNIINNNNVKCGVNIPSIRNLGGGSNIIKDNTAYYNGVRNLLIFTQ